MPVRQDRDPATGCAASVSGDVDRTGLTRSEPQRNIWATLESRANAVVRFALSPVSELRSLVASANRIHRVLPFGVPPLDHACSGGLRAGALHEFTAATAALADDAAVTLFVAGASARAASGSASPVLWVATRDDFHAPGLEQAGLPAVDVIHVRPRDDAAVLAVVEDAIRDGSPAAVVGEVSRMAMVATRRLQLAAADADMPVLVLRRRRSRDRDPLAEPSAAWTRWRIGTAPSARLDAPGVGRARWRVELVRRRGGEPFSTTLGAAAVFRLAPVASHVPEREVSRVGPLTAPGRWPAWRRPARLLPRPEPLARVVALLPDHPPRRFEWRGRVHDVVAGDGPERIHGEWWRRDGEVWAVRDYWRVEDADGGRYWIFRRGDGVAAGTGDLSWWLHGLFGCRFVPVGRERRPFPRGGGKLG